MLHVFHIDAGRMMTYDINYAAETVATLKDALAQTVNAHPNEQILLISGGEVLDNPERRVSRYSAGTDSNPIFLVCRPTGEYLGQSNYGGQSTSPTPDLMNTSEMEQQIQQAAQAPPTFHTIQLCVQLARRLVQSADANVERCSQLVFDQHLLHQGWLAVIANLDDTVTAFRQRLTKFRDKVDRFAGQRQRAVDLLNSFEADAMLLKKIPLLPCLLPAGELSQSTMANMSLFEWISSKEPEHSLHGLATDARQALDRLLDPRIVENLASLEGATVDRAQDISMKEIGGLGKRLSRLDEYLQHVKKLQIEQRQYAESLRAQEQRAATVNDSSIVADLCLNHLSALKKMLERQKQVADITRRFYEAKSELLKNIHIRLRWVAETHQLIQTGDSKVMLNGERLHRLRRQLELLKQLHDAPFVYASAVTEVVRRKAFSREFLDWADRLTDKSRQLYSDENRLRDIFAEKFDRHFLRTLFPGLDDRTPEFAHEPPEPFDASLPAVDVDHVRELRSAVPQLQHLLYVQKPNVYERVLSTPPSSERQPSSVSIRREASFFSQTPPKYAAGASNLPVSGSAPVIIYGRNAPTCQSPSWFAGDEMEFFPSSGAETGSGAGLFLASAAVTQPVTIPAAISEEVDDARMKTIVSDSDSETTSGNQETVWPSIGNGGAARSAPIKIPSINRNTDIIPTTTAASIMTASRGQFSEKGSSSKFGTPDENLMGQSPDDNEQTIGDALKPTTAVASKAISTATSTTAQDSAREELLSCDLAEKSAQLISALENQQTLRHQLHEREVEVDNYRSLLSSKVIPELIEMRRFFEELKRTFEELAGTTQDSKKEWSEIIDRAARKLEANLQHDLEETRKAEDELRRTELDSKLQDLSKELEEERKRSREIRKQFENNEAFLKQKDDVIELLQQRLQEQEATAAKQVDEATGELMKRLLIEQELAADTLRVDYEREIEMKDVEIQQLKQEVAERQHVLKEMRKEQDRLMASMCERSDFITGQSSVPSPDHHRTDDFEERLRQVKADLERDYKDKLQRLTAGLESKHAQQLERARKEKEVELRMLRVKLEKQYPAEIGELASANLEAWRSTENMADAVLNQSTTASTMALFHQSSADLDKEDDECGEAEFEEEELEDQSPEHKQKADSGESNAVSPDQSSSTKKTVSTRTRAVQTKSDSTKISVLKIAKSDLVLLVFDPQFKTFVVFTVSPTLYVLKDSCYQRMGCFQKTAPTTGADSSSAVQTVGPAGESMIPRQRWILGRVLELDYCQIKKPTNRYGLPMNTRFFRVSAEPVVLKSHS